MLVTWFSNKIVMWTWIIMLAFYVEDNYAGMTHSRCWKWLVNGQNWSKKQKTWIIAHKNRLITFSAFANSNIRWYMLISTKNILNNNAAILKFCNRYTATFKFKREIFISKFQFFQSYIIAEIIFSNCLNQDWWQLVCLNLNLKKILKYF
jgi:hypothetical protein